MAGEKNLKPFGQGTRSKEEEREMQARGGRNSGETRRRKRTMKAAAKMLLDMGVTSEKEIAKLKDIGVGDDDLTYQIAVVASMVTRAIAGDVNAATFLRDTVGESPAQKIHESEMKLRREEFTYQKEKDAGATGEIEDMDDIEATIYGDSEDH